MNRIIVMSTIQPENLSTVLLSRATDGNNVTPMKADSTASLLRPAVSTYLGSDNADISSLLVVTDLVGSAVQSVGFAQIQESAYQELSDKISAFSEINSALLEDPDNSDLLASRDLAEADLSDFVGKNLAAEPIVRVLDPALKDDQSRSAVTNPGTLMGFALPSESQSTLAAIELDMDDVIFSYHNASACPVCQANVTAASETEYPANGPSTTTGNVTGAAGVSTTGKNYIDSLISGVKWDIDPDETLTYSMYDSNVGLSYTGWIPYELGDQEGNMRIAFETWDTYLPFAMDEVDESGTTVGELRAMYNDITATNAAAGSAAQGAYPNSGPSGGDAYYHLNYTSGVADASQGSLSSNLDFSVGTYGFLTAIHEIGHNLGLKHPFGTGTVLPTAEEDIRYSIMAYSSIDDLKVTFTSTGGGYSYGASSLVPVTPMVYDIAAVENWYGTVTDTNSGDTTYSITDPDAIQAIVDAGGTDTLDLSGMEQRSIVDLTPGAYSSLGYWSMADQVSYYSNLVGVSAATVQGVFDTYDTISTSANISGGTTSSGGVYERQNNFGIAYSAVIENVIGSSGDDEITGNTADNEITGGSGDDTIDGGSGTDTAIFTGKFSEYTITDNNDGTHTVADNTAGRDGSDTISNVEAFQFSDKTYAVSGANAGTTQTNPGVVEILTKGSTKEGSGGSYLSAAVRNNPVLRGLASPHGFSGINQLLELQFSSTSPALSSAARASASISNQFNSIQNQMQQNIITNLRSTSTLDPNSAQAASKQISQNPSLMANSYNAIQADMVSRWLRG